MMHKVICYDYEWENAMFTMAYVLKWENTADKLHSLLLLIPSFETFYDQL